jgi:vacuolar protein sorting-associated protein 13A/C
MSIDRNDYWQFRKYRPSLEEFNANSARARLRFAGAAVLDGVRERHRQWTWSYFAERRDDRLKYIDLFQKKLQNLATPSVSLNHIAYLTLTAFGNRN